MSKFKLKVKSDVFLYGNCLQIGDSHISLSGADYDELIHTEGFDAEIEAIDCTFSNALKHMLDGGQAIMNGYLIHKYVRGELFYYRSDDALVKSESRFNKLAGEKWQVIPTKTDEDD